MGVPGEGGYCCRRDSCADLSFVGFDIEVLELRSRGLGHSDKGILSYALPYCFLPPQKSAW